MAPVGLALRWWDFLFYALFGLVVTSLAQIGGALLAIGWTTAMVASVVGLYLAYRFDFPTGAAIVFVPGVALVLAGVGAHPRGLRKRIEQKRW